MQILETIKIKTIYQGVKKCI